MKNQDLQVKVILPGQKENQWDDLKDKNIISPQEASELIYPLYGEMMTTIINDYVGCENINDYLTNRMISKDILEKVSIIIIRLFKDYSKEDLYNKIEKVILDDLDNIPSILINFTINGSIVKNLITEILNLFY